MLFYFGVCPLWIDFEQMSCSVSTVMSLALLHRSASRLTRIVQTEESMREDMSRAYVTSCEVLLYVQMYCPYEKERAHADVSLCCSPKCRCVALSRSV